MGKTDEKEIYRLWWEYLRRSEDYKELCEWWQEKRKNKKLPPPDKFKNINGGAHPIVWTFRRLSDVHAYSFDKWWKWFLPKVIQNRDKQKGRSPRRIEHFKASASFHFKFCIRDFKKLHGREPTLKEFTDYFPLWLDRGLYPGSIYLMVRVAGETTENLSEHFRKTITQARKNPKMKMQEIFAREHIRPVDAKGSTKLRLDELRIYLQVYDLKKQGLKTKAIIKKHNPNLDSEDDAIQRLYRGYWGKAQRIIKNVEHGRFPGQYEKSSPLKRKAENR